MIELDSYLKDIKPELPSLNINRVFFFDESNNIKKGIIGFDGDNNDDLERNRRNAGRCRWGMLAMTFFAAVAMRSAASRAFGCIQVCGTTPSYLLYA